VVEDVRAAAHRGDSTSCAVTACVSFIRKATTTPDAAVMAAISPMAAINPNAPAVMPASTAPTA
jgi:hypothetical protein